MSGRHAMAVRLQDGLGEAFDEHMNDVCITFAELLVRLASGVIAGAKPAAIFSIPMRVHSGGRWRSLTREALDEGLRAYADALPAYGVRMTVLYRNERRIYLLVWRPLQLSQALEDPRGAEILSESGYRGACLDDHLRELRRRLVDFYLSFEQGVGEFPHEIGIFLGYPPEDVRGFMEGREATCRGPWHAYGDERVARQRFEALAIKERACQRRFAAGEPFHALFAPEAACA